MKYLKAYKLFESEDFDVEEMIKELFLELEDEGFVIKVEPNYSSASRDEVFSYNVMIKKYWENENGHQSYYGPTFILRDVLDSITMCSGYLKDNGWHIWDVDGLVLNKMGRYVVKDVAYIANLDPKINFQERGPEPLFDVEMVRLKLIIRKKK
jgi:glucan-binding YG repeat protein